MARKRHKLKEKAAGDAPPPEDKQPNPVASERIHEVFGILTLASALLLGPALVSVHLGDGTLMGPFGQTLGSALNAVFGVTGYFVVALLVVVSVRIFAGALGKAARQRSNLTLWRERVGVGLGLVFITMLLHLGLRPARISGASPGGFVGELGAELLRAVLSTPGAWVVSLAGLATATVLATTLSWARLFMRLLALVRRALPGVAEAVRRGRARTRLALASLQQLFQRGEVASAGNGTAALPPVVRLDLRNESLPGKTARASASKAAVKEDGAMPADLLDRPAPHDAAGAPPTIHGAEKPPKPELAIVEAESGAPVQVAGAEPEPEQSQEQASDPTADPSDEARPSQENEIAALTIVEPEFREAEAHEAGAGPALEEQPRRRVEPTDGPGFVLSGDTYQAPPLDLLNVELRKDTNIDRDAIYQQADKLVRTLADYKIRGQVTEVHPGPVVTMYEFKPAPGTRISKVASLSNDLAMSLAAQRVRIVAPIPGKSAIGIEVPNQQRDTVYFKEIVAHKAFRSGKSRLTLALGKNIFGAPVTVDLSKMPHLLVAGATGAGKSVSVNAMICSLLLKCSPEEVRLIMVDPKYLELSGYNEIPHLMLPVVTDPSKANIALRWAVREMERRYQLLADMRVRDIQSYNRKVDRIRGAALSEEAAEGEAPQDPQLRLSEAAPSKILVVRKNADGTEEPVAGETAAPAETGQDSAADTAAEQRPETCEAAAPGAAGPDPEKPRRPRKHRGPLPKRLPFIVVVIDEFADLMMVASKDVETSVARLAQKARAAGIHVILATQRPSVDVITGLIKANFPSRISFQVASVHDSKTILGTMGAENLLGAGDMLVLDRGADMKRIHGAYISDEEIQRIIEWLKDQGRPVYDMDILQPKDEDDEPATQQPDEDYDAMYDQAVALVAETRQASISMIQRRLRVGYNRAARMVERMERDGVVGPPDGVKGREVLIDPI